MDFLQTIELLNLLMKIYVYRWNTQIGAKIPLSGNVTCSIECI